MEHKEFIKALVAVGLVALVCSTILCLLESYIYSRIDDEEIIIATKEVKKVVEVTKEMATVPEIEDRKSALISLGSSNRKKDSSSNK